MHVLKSKWGQVRLSEDLRRVKPTVENKLRGLRVSVKTIYGQALWPHHHFNPIISSLSRNNIFIRTCCWLSQFLHSQTEEPNKHASLAEVRELLSRMLEQCVQSEQPQSAWHWLYNNIATVFVSAVEIENFLTQFVPKPPSAVQVNVDQKTENQL